MTIVNCCVVDKLNHKTLLKWKILKCDVEATIAEFFVVVCRQYMEVEPNSLSLEMAFVGRSKETLDSTDLDVNLGEAVHTFGSYLKYEVKPNTLHVHCTTTATSSSVSAFAIMMAAQRDACRPRLPDRLEKDKLTRKQELYNDVIGLLEKFHLSWKGNDAANSSGVRLVKVLVECFWYLDGRYHIFAKQGYSIPPVFSNFTGYNVPQASKHRKRVLDNMDASTLCEHTTSLLSCLQGAYWNESVFSNFKKQIEQLIESLLGYQYYLESQNKKMRFLHESEVPVLKLSDSLTVEIVKKSHAVLPCFNNLNETLSQVEPYQHLPITEFCPSEVQPRYRYIQQLKSGLNVPFVILTYRPGNNMGNCDPA